MQAYIYQSNHIQAYIYQSNHIQAITNQAFRDLFKAGLRQTHTRTCRFSIQYSLILSSRAGERSRGEQQGVEKRAGGRSSGQGRALTLGAWGGCREEQRREADGSPAGRRMGPL